MGHLSTTMTTVIIILSCLLLLLGYFKRKEILNRNQCRMTYSFTGSSQLKMNRTLSGYNLWKIDHPQKGILNEHPVLFIPGSGGRMAQARSLSQSVHNDGTFQYFVAGLGNEWSALHGSTVVRQATFINDAIETIRELYEREKNRSVRVIIVAHSVGGIVARTSLLLSNQPKGCLVKAIIMLGTPNSAPAFSPDASMDLIYHSVNNAWRQSFFNESNLCKSQKRRYIPTGKVDANFDCPRCTAKTTLISISGGEIDDLVHPALTHLDVISPRPRNITSVQTKGTSFIYMNYFSPQYWIGQASSAIKVLFVSHVNNTDSELLINKTANEFINKTDGDVIATCDSDTVGSSEPSFNSSLFHPSLSSVNMDTWRRDMTTYLRPRHISIRTSQMANVGFPVDHKAILWCYEVIESVAIVLKGLTGDPEDNLDIEDTLKTFTGVGVKKKLLSPRLPVSDEDERAIRTLIGPVQELVRRNISLNEWIAHVAVDRSYLYSLVDRNPLFASAAHFYMHHIASIAIAYVSLACLSLAASQFRDVTAHTLASLRYEVTGRVNYGLPMLTDYNLMDFWVLTGMDIVFPSMVALFSSTPVLSSKTNNLRYFYPACVLILIIGGKVLYDILFKEPVEIVVHYATLIELLMSCGLALTFRYILLALVRFSRWIFSLITYVVMFIARWTVWCKPVRGYVRGLMKRPLDFVVSCMTRLMFTYLFFLSLAVAIGYMWYEKQGKLRGMDIEDSFSFSAIAVFVSYWFVVFALIISIFFPPVVPKRNKKEDLNKKIAKAKADQAIELLRTLLREKSELELKWDNIKEDVILSQMHSVSMNSLILLYLPVVASASSTWMFARDFLGSDKGSYGPIAAIITRFGPDMLTYAVCLTCISLHILLSWVKYHVSYPTTFVEELAGPDSDAFPPITSCSTNDDPIKCCHEDGGRFAVYSQGDESELVKVNEAIFLGPSYRVLSCKCSADVGLKTMNEWCGFCRCLKCGGKDATKNKDEAFQNRSDRYRKLSHLLPLGSKPLSSSLLLFLGLVGLAFFNIQYSYSHMYRLLYSMAAVASIYLTAMLGEYFKLF